MSARTNIKLRRLIDLVHLGLNEAKAAASSLVVLKLLKAFY
ncbi:hypothetical protein [Methylobacterium sp. D54C]